MSADLAPYLLFLLPTVGVLASLGFLSAAERGTAPVGPLVAGGAAYAFLLLYLAATAFGFAMFRGFYSLGLVLVVLAAFGLGGWAVALRPTRRQSAAHAGAFWLCALYGAAVALSAVGFLAAMAGRL